MDGARMRRRSGGTLDASRVGVPFHPPFLHGRWNGRLFMLHGTFFLQTGSKQGEGATGGRPRGGTGEEKERAMPAYKLRRVSVKRGWVPGSLVPSRRSHPRLFAIEAASFSPDALVCVCCPSIPGSGVVRHVYYT